VAAIIIKALGRLVDEVGEGFFAVKGIAGEDPVKNDRIVDIGLFVLFLLFKHC